MTPRAKRVFLILFAIDAVVLAALIYWLVFHYTKKAVSAVPGKPDIQINLRHLETKLTEIDLVNKGAAPGSLDLAADISWQDSDLDRAEGLAGFDEIDTGRMSTRFHPHRWPSGEQLSPGESRDIGWVQLKDDSPIHAQIVTGPAATQP
ncbi:MAG: hypothetical protein ABSB33_01905 [Tepidisphaeraceae bacterium]